MPFNKQIANSILASNVGNYVGLFTSEPDDNGNFSEPTIDTSATGSAGGYKRGVVTTWDTSKDRQVANKELILMFEARSAFGTKTFTHFGLFKSATDKTLIFYGEISPSLTVSDGYVPLIRAYELIIGMDVTSIDTSY